MTIDCERTKIPNIKRRLEQRLVPFRKRRRNSVFTTHFFPTFAPEQRTYGANYQRNISRPGVRIVAGALVFCEPESDAQSGLAQWCGTGGRGICQRCGAGGGRVVERGAPRSHRPAGGVSVVVRAGQRVDPVRFRDIGDLAAQDCGICRGGGDTPVQAALFLPERLFHQHVESFQLDFLAEPGDGRACRGLACRWALCRKFPHRHACGGTADRLGESVAGAQDRPAFETGRA